MQGAYGQLNMAAQANSVQCLSILSDGWTVGGVVLALLAIRLLLLAASAAAVMLLSRRCAMVPALLLSLLLLLLPVGAAYALDVKDTKRVRTSPSAPFLAYNM